MNCTEARDGLLVADIVELRAASDTSLAAHVQTCAECGRLTGLATHGVGATGVIDRA